MFKTWDGEQNLARIAPVPKYESAVASPADAGPTTAEQLSTLAQQNQVLKTQLDQMAQQLAQLQTQSVAVGSNSQGLQQTLAKTQSLDERLASVTQLTKQNTDAINKLITPLPAVTLAQNSHGANGTLDQTTTPTPDASAATAPTDNVQSTSTPSPSPSKALKDIKDGSYGTNVSNTQNVYFDKPG